jgi:hypothetical protein
MTSTFTPNKNLELPGFNDYVDSWNTPVNADFTAVDTALGGVTNLNATAVSGDVTLTSTQYRPIQIVISGTLTANVRYLIPSSVGGQWTITNSTTGAFTLSVASAAGGSNITLPSGTTIVSCDGTATGMRLSLTSTAVTSFSAGTTGLTPSTATQGAVTLAGTLAVTNGGTGLTTTPANGQVDIGNGTNFTRATLTAGSGISITNGAGSITITATAQQPFAAGTVIVFGQTAAPTGWTKITTNNNAALRIVSGAASSGGSVDFTTAFTSQAVSGTIGNTTSTGTVGSTTLSTAQIPSHTHTYDGNVGGGCSFDGAGSSFGSRTSGATGGGGSHNHSLTMDPHTHSFTGTAINLAVKYVDVIFASKD